MSEHMRSEPIELLRTKLYRPRTASEFIPRGHLCRVLDQYLQRPATLVCAPAGYGKSSSIAFWLEQCSCPSVWLSLDAGDSDLGVFLAYFVAAVRSVFPMACPNTLSLLNAPILAPVRALATALINDLDDLVDELGLQEGQRLVLVLDDYHTIDNPAVHTLLGEVLRHPPRTVHLIMSARHDPPLPLNLLRSHSALGEIRVSDLRFTREETAQLAELSLGAPLDADALDTLVEITEGWGTGLRLAIIALNAGGDLSGSLRPSDFGNQQALDFLLHEVLARVPSVTQRFLLQTSILDRLTGPLCEALTGLSDRTWNGQAYLTWMSEQNLFTFALGADGKWFRYHHLFRKLLYRELEATSTPAEIARLHRSAAKWFEQNGLLEEAMQHALAAGDDSTAVRLIESHRHEAMNRENWRQLEYWFGLVPRSLIDERPELLILEAWLWQKQWRFPDLASLLDRIEDRICQAPLVEADCRRLRGEVAALRSATDYYQLQIERSTNHACEALELLPAECSAARGLAWMYRAGDALARGDVDAARDILLEGIREDQRHGNPFSTRVYVGLCLLEWMSGNMPGLLRVSVQMRDMARSQGLNEAVGLAEYHRGCALYQLNDLDAACGAFEHVVANRYLTHGFAYSQSAMGLAMVYAARGEMRRVREVLDAVTNYGLETANIRIIADADACRIALLHRANDPAEPSQWQESFNSEAPLAPLNAFAYSHILLARVLVDADSPAKRAKARRMLDRLRELAENTHNVRALVEVLAVQALLCEAEGKREAALDRLSQAVALAEPGGIVRVILDQGPAMAALVRLLLTVPGRSTPRASQEFIARLLAAFAVSAPARSSPNQSGLIEPLTYRELEVLELLRERLMHKEIGQKLDISPMTVKRHATNIYEKLGVGNRRDAVAKAESLGLLTAPMVAKSR